VYAHLRPNEPRPFRLPTWCKWLALAIFVFWMALGLLIVALYAGQFLRQYHEAVDSAGRVK
jgi:hypothetical protein